MRLLRPVAVTIVAAILFAFGAVPAFAVILVEIDKSTQRMTVSQDGAQLYNWPVSTGLRAYDTPNGSFKPFRMEKEHFSREWDDAPMPHSIFFTTRGHAIHGTEHKRNIGRPASHGCVRLEPQNARVLFNLVKQQGMANTRVVLTGTVPGGSTPAVVRRAPTYQQDYQQGYDDQRGFPRDDRPLYGPQTRPPFFDDGTPYQRMPPPTPRYVEPRRGLY